MLKLLLLGKPELTSTSEDTGHVPFGKPLAVLVYVSFGEDPVARSELASLLWPGSSRKRARHSVREALSRLRRALGDDIFEGDDPVRVRREKLWIDSDALGEALGEGDLETANALWRGPFLDELVIPDAPPWERWKDDVRHRLEAAFGRALRQAGEEALDTGRPSQAARWFRRATEIQPYSVRAHRFLLETLLRLRRLDVWEDAWRSAQAHLAPLDALSELDDVRKRAAAVRDEMRAGASHGGGPAVPFVGRSEELRALLDAWSRVLRRQSGTVLLRGAAGVGKTRLSEELVRRIQDEATAVHVRPAAEGSQRPLGVVRSLVTELRSRPGSRGTAPEFESVLQMLEASGSRPVRESLDPATVAEATEDLLGAVAFEAPLLVVIDDAHRADEASLEILERLVSRELSTPVMLIICMRDVTDGDAQPDIARRLVESGEDQRVRLIELRPFSKAATGRLLGSFLTMPEDGAKQVVTQVQDLTQGNALFVVEFVQALFQAGAIREADGRWIMTTTNLSPIVHQSSTVAGLIASRLGRLPDDAKLVAKCLALEEGPVPVMELRGKSKLEAAAFVRAVALLSEWRIVRWLDDERIDVAHDRFREVGRDLETVRAPKRNLVPFGLLAGAALLIFVTWGAIVLAGSPGDAGAAESGAFRGGRLLHLSPEGVEELRFDADDDAWRMVSPTVPAPSRWTHQMRAWRTENGVRWMGTDRNDVIAPFAVEVHLTSRVDTLFRSEGDESPVIPSADGTLGFLVTENPDTEVYDRDVMRMDLATGDTTRIYRGGGVLMVIDRAPGADLLLVSATGRPDTLLVMDHEGRVHHRATAEVIHGISWCGPGPEVAALYHGEDGTATLGLINMLTGRTRELLVTQVTGRIECAPDGSAILFPHVVDRRPRLGLLDRSSGAIDVLPEWTPTGSSLHWIPDEVHPAVQSVRIEGAPDSVQMGRSIELRTVTTYADGRAREEEVAWTSSDPSILSVLPDGRAYANRVGRATIHAEALGGVQDSVTIEVTPADVEQLLFQDRFERLDSARWFVASEPPPDVTYDGSEPVMDFRGDGRYKDRLVSKEAFLLSRGGTLEVEFRMTLTQPDRQNIRLCLQEANPMGPDPLEAASDPLGWQIDQNACVRYPGGEGARFDPTEVQFNSFTRRFEDRLPPVGWTHIGVQLRSDGQVSLILDREVVFTSPILEQNGPDTRWRVVLGGAAVDTEVQFRDLRLWDGARYGG